MSDLNPDVTAPAWIIEPPADGEFKLLVAVGNDTALPDSIAQALAQLLDAIDSTEGVIRDAENNVSCIIRDIGPCPGRGICGGKGDCGCKGTNCRPNRRVVGQGMDARA
jgi:hypothetical protein